MANKKTKIDLFNEILPLCVTDEQKEFINKLIAQTAKKNAGNKNGELTPKQKAEKEANEAIKTTVLATLSAEPKTIADIIGGHESLNTLSPQKISAILTKLLAENMIVRTEKKGRAYFALPVAEG